MQQLMAFSNRFRNAKIEMKKKYSEEKSVQIKQNKILIKLTFLRESL